MERCMKQYDKDYMEMKTIMLKQEETFRHQVHELHRLYQIQKLLMRNTKTAAMNMRRYMKPDIELWNVENETPSHRNSHGRQPLCSLDLEAPAESIRRHSGDEESDLELTLATGSSRAQRKRKMLHLLQIQDQPYLHPQLNLVV